MAVRSQAGTITANSSYPADGFIVNDTPCRVIIKTGTFGGGTIHLTVKGEDGSYYRTGESWTSAGVKVIDPAGVACVFKLEMADASSPSVPFEFAV